MKEKSITNQGTLYYLLFLVWILISTIHGDDFEDPYHVAGLPDGYDDWCKETCGSFRECSDRFEEDFIDLRLKVNYPLDQGPGESLVSKVFLGNTVSRQTFETQFILDIAKALDISPCQLHVLNIDFGSNHFSWESNSVLVSFRLFPADVNKVRALTFQIQQPNSDFFKGRVTREVDQLFGLVTIKWDFSLRLTISINVIDKALVQKHEDVLYLNQGSTRWCVDNVNKNSSYCKFEQFFQDDIASSLSIERNQVEILFIKNTGKDAVLVFFRFIPEPDQTKEHDALWINVRVNDLMEQMNDMDSKLYKGNITVRVDQTWGLSGYFATPRTLSKYLPYNRRNTTSDLYELCKLTQRCARGWSHYHQTNATLISTMQSFAGGFHQNIDLFDDFEDWRQGTYGWRSIWKKYSNLSDIPKGSHWSPFDFDSHGPIIPSYNTTSNNGLVLNKDSLLTQISKQQNWIDEITFYINWLEHNIEVATLNAHERSRKDVEQSLSKTRDDYKSLLTLEKNKLQVLSQSQCTNVTCDILFNTSSLELSGAIEAIGVIGMTTGGIEVAVWVFDSIDLSTDVNVTLTGQRAMALISRSSIQIDTEFMVHPGTLGGFPGGYSVARKEEDRWISICPEGEPFANFSVQNYICPGDQPLSELVKGIHSSNINGPGSGSVQVILKTIETTAMVVKEIIEITSNASQGEILSGGFIVHFNGYNTSLIPHDATSNKVKYEMEDGLNAFPFSRPTQYPENRNTTRPGIGKINVSRKSVGTSGGFTWRITFESAVGNIGNVDSKPLQLTNLLVGNGASLDLVIIEQGNAIGGYFSLQFLGSFTRPIPHDASSYELETILMEDVSSLETAHVVRTDPTSTNNCNDGFCENGPNQAGGYIWTLTLTTLMGNDSPPSPTASVGYDDEHDLHPNVQLLELTVFQNNLTGCVKSQCPKIIISDGHKKSHVKVMENFVAPEPFSLSYGGAGAGYGGKGGQGFGAANQVGQAYGDEDITDLYGGSGGALGFKQPYEANMFSRPWGRGGSGGGALELVATNDIILGPHSTISCNGENGHDGFVTAGGGGSGGSILLSAGGIIQHKGHIFARGGDGGKATQYKHKHFTDIEDGHGGAGSGGRVAMYGESITIDDIEQKLQHITKVDVSGGKCSDGGVPSRTRVCDGESGTFFKEESLRQYAYIDQTNGAAGTQRSLHLRNHKPTMAKNSQHAKSSSKNYHFSQYTIEFDLSKTQASNKPGRVTFFLKLGPNDKSYNDISKDKRGFSFEMKENTDAKNKQFDNSNVVIGVFAGDEGIKHGANYHGISGDTTYAETLTPFLSNHDMKRNKWYHFDIRINWDSYTYDIYLDNVLLVENISFAKTVTGIGAIGLGNFHASASAWIDEIYVGMDSTMGFKCPVVSTETKIIQDEGTIATITEAKIRMNRPTRTGWKELDIGGPSYKHEKIRHENHISKRPLYNRHDNGGLVPFDGEGHDAFVSDVKYSFGENGDRRPAPGKFLYGSILEVPMQRHWNDMHDEKNNANRTRPMNQTQYIWYGEHNNTSGKRDGYFSAEDGPTLIGGIGACSTTDFQTWKNEGIMLNYINITDMVEGTPGPFHVERPKVLYNSKTKKYVMWMVIDNEEQSLGMASVAVSDYPNGPYDFVRSLFPDGNMTRDQTIVYGSNSHDIKTNQDGDNVPNARPRPAYLIRTYYATVEFVLPAAIMQPVWESVKNRDGTINFALSHHRANYEPGYDDYHDIYLQRWRKEDIPWKIICVNKVTGVEREVKYGVENLNYDGEMCHDMLEYKKVLGQASPLQENSANGLKSRFLDPDDMENNVWMPDSVPGIKAQPWNANYRDGSCGMTNKDLDMQRLDPDLPNRVIEDKKDCSNVADNPIHEHAPDKLIGPKRVIQKRRAKFVAISRLTDDYLDSSGVLMSYEGELENEEDLISLVESDGLVGGGYNEEQMFGWTSGEDIGSTFKSQVESEYFRTVADWEKRFHQYEENYNDRAKYSTACVLDGRCPVNFRNQITQGHQ